MCVCAHVCMCARVGVHVHVSVCVCGRARVYVRMRACLCCACKHVRMNGREGTWRKLQFIKLAAAKGFLLPLEGQVNLMAHPTKHA